MGIVMSALSLSIAFGVPLGSGLAQLSDWRIAFWASATLGALAGVVLSVTMPSAATRLPARIGGGSPTHTEGDRASYFSGFHTIATNRVSCAVLATNLLWMTGFYAIYTFLGTHLSGAFGLDIAQTGLVFVAYGLGNFLASFFSGRVIARLTPVRAMIVLLVVLALVQGLGATSISSHVVTTAPNDRSTIMSLNSCGLFLGLTIASALGSRVFSCAATAVIASPGARRG